MGRLQIKVGTAIVGGSAFRFDHLHEEHIHDMRANVKSRGGVNGEPMNLHEEALVKAFVEKSRQERFLTFLADPKKRRKFTDELAHRRDRFLQPKFFRSIPPSQQHPPGLFALLKSLGAPDSCWVVSEGHLDGREVALSAALKEVVGYGMGTLISCIPGRLAYFESEDERFILQK
jgi:hypothetical protein